MSIQQMMLGASGGFALDWDYGSLVNGIEDTGTVDTLEYPRVFADPYNENRWAFCYTDDDGSKRAYLRLATRSGNTLTFSPTYDFADQTQVSQGNGLFMASGKLLMHYSYNYGKTYARVISFSGSAGSETFSRSSQTQICNRTHNWNYGVQPVAVGTTGRYLFPYYNYSERTNGSSGQDGYMRIITATTSGITYTGGGGSDGFFLEETGAQGPQVVMHPDDDTRGLMALCNNSGKLVVRSLVLSGTENSASVSVGSQQLASNVTIGGVSGGGFVSNYLAGTILISNGGDKFTVFGTGDSGVFEKDLVGIAFDYDGTNFTFGNPVTAPENISPRYRFTEMVGEVAPGGSNKMGIVYEPEDRINNKRGLYSVACTRKDDRTLTFSDLKLLENGATNDPSNLHSIDIAVQSDNANTALVVYNNNLSNTNYGNLAGKLIQLGS